MDIGDDFGNMILSVGLAQQQQAQARQGLEPSTTDAVQVHGRSTNGRAKPSMLTGVLRLDSRLTDLGVARKACVTCHQRYVSAPSPI